MNYTFKATAGDQQVESAAPLTYADALVAQFVSHVDDSPLASTDFVVHSPWGTKTGTTDAEGNAHMDQLPPGGVRVVIAGDVLTSSDAQ